MFEAIKINQLKAKKDYTALIELFSSPNPAVVQMAIDALVTLGEDYWVVLSLTKELMPHNMIDRSRNYRGRGQPVWRSAVSALIAINNQTAAKHLLMHYHRMNDYVQEEVAPILRSHSALVLETLQPELDHAEAEKRIAVVKLLGSLRLAQAVEPLLARLDDPDQAVVGAALAALERLANPLAIPKLQQLVQARPALRKQALFTLKKMGWQGQAADEAWVARYQGDWAKCASFGADADEALVDAFANEPPKNQAAIVTALVGQRGGFSTPALMAWLNRLLDLRDQRKNQNGGSSDLNSAAWEIIKSILKQGDPSVLEPALKAIERVGEIGPHGRPIAAFLCRHKIPQGAAILNDLYQRYVISPFDLNEWVSATFELGGFDLQQANQFLQIALQRDYLYYMKITKLKEIAECAETWAVDQIASNAIDRINASGYSQPRGEMYIFVLEELYRSGRMGDGVKHRLLTTANELDQRHTDYTQRPNTDDDMVAGSHTDQGLKSRYLPLK